MSSNPFCSPNCSVGHESPESTDPAVDIAAALARRLADTAVERDKAGGHAAQERERIRDTGLPALSIPTEFGGQGADWATAYLLRCRDAVSASARKPGPWIG